MLLMHNELQLQDNAKDLHELSKPWYSISHSVYIPIYYKHLIPPPPKKGGEGILDKLH
jgi:hypothetical protein